MELESAYRSWLAAAESAAGNKARVTLRVRDLRKQRLDAQIARAERAGNNAAAAAAGRDRAAWVATTEKWNSGASAKFKAWYDRAGVPAEPVVRAALVAGVEDLVPTAPHTVGAWTSFGEVVERLAAIRHEGARRVGRDTAQTAGKQKRSANLAGWLVGGDPCRAGELDPVALGLGSWFFDGDLPPYAARTSDTDLLAVLTDPDRGPGKGLVVVVGPPKAGKTRSLYQALQHPDLAGRTVWWANTAPGLIPALIAALDTHATKGELPANLVVVIDDLQKLGTHPADGLTEPRLRRLTSHATVAATLHEADLSAYAHAVHDHTSDHAHAAAIGATHGLVELLQAARIDYEPALDTDEITAATEIAQTSPHAEQTHGFRYDRLPEALAAVDQLTKRAREGLTAGGYQAVLITTAIDAHHLYPTGAEPHELEDLAEWHHSQISPNQIWNPERYQQALDWATTGLGPRSPHAILQLTRTPDRYQLLDALTPKLHPHPWTPDHLHGAPLTPEGHFYAGLAAYEAGDHDQATIWWGRAADEGDLGSMFNLALLLSEQGDQEGALLWYRMGADAGDPGSMNNLATMLGEAGDRETMQSWLERAAGAGGAEAMHNLGLVLSERSDLAGARHWLECAADAGMVDAMFSLGKTYGELDDAESSLAWYQRAADAGDLDSMHILGIRLKETGDFSGARRHLQGAAEDGHIQAMHSLAIACKEEGFVEEARIWNARAASAGNVSSDFNLGRLLAELGMHEEAEHHYVRAAEAGHLDAMFFLGSAHHGRANMEEAQRWWEEAARGGHIGSMSILGVALEQAGDHEGASQWAMKALEAGEPGAYATLGKVSHSRGDPYDARHWWRQGAEAGDWQSMFELTFCLYEQGDLGGARHWGRIMWHHEENTIPFSIVTLLAEGGDEEGAHFWRAVEADPPLA